MPTLTLDDLLPAPHFHERHERRVAAPPATVWRVLHELRLADTTLSRVLMSIRLIPVRLAGHPETVRFVSGRFLEAGPVPVLAAEPGRSVVAGGVMQPWKLSGGEDPPELDAEALRAFADPGWVKVGFDLVLRPEGAGTRLTTETRITATDPATRRRFALYWRFIRAGSGLIRRDMLRAVARRAEA